jgi:CRISPR-associated endoribonuclease Cas6
MNQICPHIKVKGEPETKEQSRIVGDLFEFEQNAPAEVHKMIWNTGCSEKSSSGFGWVEMNKNT